jgi:hypothetical protein
MYSKTAKTVIEFGFCDILNDQCLGKCYQTWPANITVLLCIA